MGPYIYSPIRRRGMDRGNLKFVYPAKTFAKYTCRGNRLTIIYLVPCTVQNYCCMWHVQQSCDTMSERVYGPAVLSYPSLFHQRELGLCLPWHHLLLSNVGQAALIRISEDALYFRNGSLHDLRKLLTSPDPIFYCSSSKNQGIVINTVCRIEEEVQRCEFQFHGTAGWVSVMQGR